MALTHITDLVDKGLALLPSQFDDSPNVRGLYECLLAPFQELEDAFWQLHTERAIDNSVGAQLDGIGQILKFPRQGLADETYRPFLKAMVRVYISSGTIPEFLQVLKTLFPDAYVMLREFYPAAFIIVMNGVSLQDELVPLVYGIAARQMKPAGVGFEFHYAPETIADPDTVFRLAPDGADAEWADIVATKLPGLGLDDADAPGTGGKLISVI